MTPGRRVVEPVGSCPTYFLLFGPVGPWAEALVRTLLQGTVKNAVGRRFNAFTLPLAYWPESNAFVVLPRSQVFGSQPLTTPKTIYHAKELCRNRPHQPIHVPARLMLTGREEPRTDRFKSLG